MAEKYAELEALAASEKFDLSGPLTVILPPEVKDEGGDEDLTKTATQQRDPQKVRIFLLAQKNFSQTKIYAPEINMKIFLSE